MGVTMNLSPEKDPEAFLAQRDPGFPRIVGFSPVRLMLGLAGALVGGVLGWFIFNWGLSQGLVAHVVPGALVGVGFGLAARCHSPYFGIICGVLAFGLGLFVEWYNFPFVANDSLGYFLTHIHQLKPFNLIMIGLGVALAYSYGKGRRY